MNLCEGRIRNLQVRWFKSYRAWGYLDSEPWKKSLRMKWKQFLSKLALNALNAVIFVVTILVFDGSSGREFEGMRTLFQRH